MTKTDLRDTLCPCPSGNEERPCADLIACLTEGPSCREDGKQAEANRERMAELRRERLARPVILVGAGTCGLAAGADATLTAVREYLAVKSLAADVAEVGCIGLQSPVSRAGHWQRAAASSAPRTGRQLATGPQMQSIQRGHQKRQTRRAQQQQL